LKYFLHSCVKYIIINQISSIDYYYIIIIEKMTSNTENEIQSVFQLEKKEKIVLQLGWDTDRGGCSYNQDRKTYIPFEDGCLICVADGHGAKGEKAAEIAENLLHELVKNNMSNLLQDPVAFLELAFDSIHAEIVAQFGNIKCGTTCSIILLLGKKMWMANVGDSTGMLFSKHPIFKPSLLNFEKDAAIEGKVVVASDEGVEPSNMIELTCEGHVPENPEEYIRMRNFKRSEDNPNHAQMLCVYDDTDIRAKHLCPPVFNISEDGVPTVRPDDGSFKYYYKNVNKTKAVYLCNRYGENAMANTRSLGDNVIHELGVTHKPEIRSMDLVPVFERLKAQIATAKVEASVDPDPMTVCVVLGSDGVWDNWKTEFVQKFVMDKSCLKAVENDKVLGAQRVAKSFMERQKMYAKKNYGNNSDNATFIIMYLTMTNE
jgi:serine/threonine protein phosphatase PrpC